ncbi:MAG: hypothetical protein AAFX87_00930 [Bacteroidota bacterium]
MKTMNLIGKWNGLSKLVVIILVVGLASCSEDTEQFMSQDLVEETTLFEDEQDVDEALQGETDVFDAINLAQVPQNGKVSEDQPADSAYVCADITHDKSNQTIVIDFGDGCVGLDGVLRSGKVIITYTDHYLIPGAVLTKTFEDYFVNGKQVEGFFTLTNTAANLSAFPEFNIVLEGGQITWEDQTIATRESNFDLTWINSANPLSDEFHKEGAASGMRSGVEYNMTIQSTLIRKNICKLDGVFIPVQGVKLIERVGLPTLTIDYGDGSCDSRVVITREDGASRTIENFRRLRRRR